MSTPQRPLLPDNWQQPEREAFLDDMREAVGDKPYPGYPDQADRLYIPPARLTHVHFTQTQRAARPAGCCFLELS